MGEDRQPENIYTPAAVARRLGISGQALRRLAAGYERAVGELPRDERGRLWPAPAVDRLELARNAVRAGHYASVERALTAGEVFDGAGVPVPPPEPGAGDMAAVTELVEELRALRGAVDGMSARLEALERENRQLRERLEAAPVPGIGEGERLEVPDPPRPAPTGSTPTGPAPVGTLWGLVRRLLGRG